MTIFDLGPLVGLYNTFHTTSNAPVDEEVDHFFIPLIPVFIDI